MASYSVGDRVFIRSGYWQGQRGEVVQVQPAEVYEIRLGDGALLLFSKESLNRESAARPPHFLPGRTDPREQLV